MPVYLLLAMQASGMITDYFGGKNQSEMMRMGMKVQQAGIEANIEEARLESADSSLQAMKQLRQTMGTQLAVFAARGTSPGAGSAASLFNESLSNFNSDEKVRKLNLLGKENQLRAGSAMSRLQYSSDVSKLWQGFASRTFGRVATSSAVWDRVAKDFGMTPASGR